MNGMDTLTTAMLDLLKELEGADVPLIMGGGYGLYLRRLQIEAESRQTMVDELPEPRSTNDMDLFLRAELLADSARLKPLREAFGRLGYEVIKGAEHYQFAKPLSLSEPQRVMKIDVLTGPSKAFDGTPVKYDKRRARPRPSVNLHAHVCEEALTLTENLTPCFVMGALSSGAGYESTLWLPHPFTFLTMKLFALRDRLNDTEKDYGRHHALDLYAVIGSMAPAEWQECLELQRRYREEPVVQECVHIVSELFGTGTSMGVIRLKESGYFHSSFRTDEFVAVLNELFYSRACPNLAIF
jgi:hypothetical protein